MQSPLTRLSGSALDASCELSIAPSDRVNCSLDILAAIAHEHAVPVLKRRKIIYGPSKLPENICARIHSSTDSTSCPKPYGTGANEALPPLNSRVVDLRSPVRAGTTNQLLFPFEPSVYTSVGLPARKMSQFDAIIEASSKTGLMSPPIASVPFSEEVSPNGPTGTESTDAEAIEKHAASVLLMASRTTTKQTSPGLPLHLPSGIHQPKPCESLPNTEDSHLPSPPAESPESSFSDKNLQLLSLQKEAYHERHIRLQQNQMYRQRLEKIGLRPVRKGDGRFYCSICDRAFNKEMFVWRHGVKHLGLKPFQCKDCLVTFGRSDSLQRHTRKFHKTTDHERSGCITSPCSKVFPSDIAIQHPSTP